VLLVAVGLLLVGCGEKSSDSESKDTAAQLPLGMTATSPEGGEVTFTSVKAQCAPSEHDPSVQIVRLIAEVEGGRFLAEIVPSDVEGGRSFELPVSAGDDSTGPANARVFVGMKPNLEASTTEEGATGELEVIRASCDPVEVELTLDATLGSEYYDVQPPKVEGRLQFP
jgi:hypothetical protein